jgi:hypothetical protein
MEIGVLGFFRYGTLIGLQGLWLGPYLMDIVWNGTVVAMYRRAASLKRQFSQGIF